MTESDRPTGGASPARRGRDRRDRAGAYEIGYGKPPKHAQFRPGKSGNPKGRPKRHRNLKTVIEEALREAITIREGERKRTIPRIDALVRAIVTRALQGDARAMGNLIALIRVVGLAGDEPEAAEAQLTQDDAAFLADFLRRQGGTPAPPAAGLAGADPDEVSTRDGRTQGRKR